MWVFQQKPKTRFFGGPKWKSLKLNFEFVFLRLFFNVKGSFMPIFTKNINIYVDPLEFFENENFGPRVLKIWIWTSITMPDLWLLDLFCPIKKIFTLHPNHKIFYFSVSLTNIGLAWFFSSSEAMLYQRSWYTVNCSDSAISYKTLTPKCNILYYVLCGVRLNQKYFSPEIMGPKELESRGKWCQNFFVKLNF